MNEVKKFWIKSTSGGSYPFWETEITNNEKLKNEYEDYDDSLCLVPLSELEAEKAKAEKLKKALEFYAEVQGADGEINTDDGKQLFMKNLDDFELMPWEHKGTGRTFKVLTLGKLARQTLKEIEASDCQKITG